MMDKLSYALGLSMGQNFKGSGVDKINVSDFAAALQAVYAGEKPEVNSIDDAAAESRAYAWIEGETLYVKGVDAARIEVYSVYGAKVAERVGAQQVALNAAAGVYIVRVADAQGKISVAKVLKK